MVGGGGLLSGQHGEDAFGLPASNSWADQGAWADRTLALLQPEYLDWEIWYVPIYPVGHHWCARPVGARTSTITVGTPEDLVAEIKRHEESPARARDFSGLSVGELERTHRDLTISAALAVPSSGAYLMTVTQMQAVDAELDARRRAGTKSEGVALMGQAGRGVFEVDEETALAELKLVWADGGYHGFTANCGLWSAISSAGEVITGATPDELGRKIRAHWQAMQ